MKKEWTIKNPVYEWLARRRMARAAKKWDADVAFGRINPLAPCCKSNDVFPWQTLVLQECWMWARLNEQVTVEEFVWLCQRRGFTDEARSYLIEMLRHLGLARKLNKAESALELYA